MITYNGGSKLLRRIVEMLRPATKDGLGLVKPGSGISITADGTISASAGTLTADNVEVAEDSRLTKTVADDGTVTLGSKKITTSDLPDLPIASTSRAGVVKVGSGLSATTDGTLSASGISASSIKVSGLLTRALSNGVLTIGNSIKSIGTGLSLSSAGRLNANYASTTSPGIAQFDPNGHIKATSTYNGVSRWGVPVATRSAAGVVKPGYDLSITSDGMIQYDGPEFAAERTEESVGQFSSETVIGSDFMTFEGFYVAFASAVVRPSADGTAILRIRHGYDGYGSINDAVEAITKATVHAGEMTELTTFTAGDAFSEDAFNATIAFIPATDKSWSDLKSSTWQDLKDSKWADLTSADTATWSGMRSDTWENVKGGSWGDGVGAYAEVIPYDEDDYCKLIIFGA